MTRRIDKGPNWSNAKQRIGKWLVTYSMRPSFASLSGSVDSFHAGALEADVVLSQDQTQPLTPDRDPPVVT